MGDWVSKDMVQKAMQVDLLSYAQSLGMEFETRGSRDVFYLKGHSLNISKSKNLYNRFSTGQGGNVINFAMEMNGWTFQQAVRALCGEDIQKNFYADRSTAKVSLVPQTEEPMILPKAHTDSRRTFAYLVKTRKIDPEIVSSLMKENKIYESIEYFARIKTMDGNHTGAKLITNSNFALLEKAERIKSRTEVGNDITLGFDNKGKLKYIGVPNLHKNTLLSFLKNKQFEKISPIYNCVFCGFNEQGEIKYANMRGIQTGSVFKHDIIGADKSYCFNTEGKSDIVYVFEAPIDAMSHAALTKVCGGDWRQDWRISLGGVSDGALARFLKQHPEIKNISFCLDNDLAGNKVLKNEYNKDGSLKKAGYMKKYKDMGYNVFRDEPMNKDFNEDLQMTVEGFKKMEQEQAVPEIEEDMCL